MKSPLALLLAASALAACATAVPETTAPAAPRPVAQAPRPPKAGAPIYPPFGVDLAGMDKAVAPGDSFFLHANGAWVRTTEIPADRSSYNTFSLLRDKADRRTRELIQGVAAAPASDDERRIADYYNSFMDEAAIEAAGAAPLSPELEAIGAIRTRNDLSRLLGASMRADVDLLNATDYYTDRPFGLWVAPDMKDPDRYVAYLVQGGLGMPDREYYLSSDARYVELRAAYEAHIAAMLKLARFNDVEGRANRVLAMETAIARTHASALDTSDVEKGYNPWSRDDFTHKAVGLNWPAFFEAAGLGDQQTIVVWQPSAAAGMAELARTQSLAAWRDYLTFRAIERAAPFMPKAFVDQSFAFNGKALSGTPALSERWKRGVETTNAGLGMAVGKLYAAKHFPPQSKVQMQAMVGNILVAFGERIDNAAWMSDATRARAKAKLGTVTVGIGYPDQWRDYSGLTVVAGDPLGNANRSGAFDYAYALGKLKRPVDRTEWFMTPQTVNALNVPQANGIFFPAAILEAPFFDPNADAAVNYGAIGGVIGHEITHSFDDTGALFDERGALANWWTPEDLARFKAAGKALAGQYGAYRPFPDLALNGEQTLGENIADVAGLTIAYDGWKRSLGGAAPPVIAGFTGDQRFFLGWAQNYRSKYREAALRRAIVTGVHSPGEYRASTVRNLDAWYGAFDVQPGQALYLAPEDRVRVW